MTPRKTRVAVLFVCLGNICRSPAAEGVFRHYAGQQGEAASLCIDSAGVGDWHSGRPADPRMREAAARRGYDLDSIARQVRRADLEEFDLVIAMDRDNLRSLEQLAGRPQSGIRLLGEFLPDHRGVPAHAPQVPDPYYGGEEGFEEVLDLLERACPGLLAACRAMLGGD